MTSCRWECLRLTLNFPQRFLILSLRKINLPISKNVLKKASNLTFWLVPRLDSSKSDSNHFGWRKLCLNIPFFSHLAFKFWKKIWYYLRSFGKGLRASVDSLSLENPFFKLVVRGHGVQGSLHSTMNWWFWPRMTISPEVGYRFIEDFNIPEHIRFVTGGISDRLIGKVTVGLQLKVCKYFCKPIIYNISYI